MQPCLRIGLRLTWDIVLLLVLLLEVFFFVTNSSGVTWYDVLPSWPDPGSWLVAVCTLLLLIGVIRAVLAIRQEFCARVEMLWRQL